MGEKAIVGDITLSALNTMLSNARSEYNTAHRKIKRLDALDRNKLWDELNAKFPNYQLLPQTNHVSYIKNNLIASIYSVGKQATLVATSEHDKDIIGNLNIALEHIWANRSVGKYELLAGERAALTNLGITQVGWDNSIITGCDANFEKGQVVLKNIDPLKYYRDPYAESLDTASFVVTWEDYHKSVIEQNPLYKDEFKKVAGTTSGVSDAWYNNVDMVSQTGANKPGYHRVYTWFVRHKEGIAEIHVLDMKTVLFKRDKISPAMFPFAELYCNIPAGDLIGVSEPAKIADNSIVYNIMQSILTTAEYRNQRPPKFVSTQSGINVPAFIKYGADADKTFVVQGDASKAVHYHQFPQPSGLAQSNMAQLSNDIQFVTGVDGRYTGRDTGSVITTGGVNSMLDQVTLIDTTKILLYEEYAKKLSKLIIFNYITNSVLGRNYLVKDTGKVDSYSLKFVDFPRVPDNIVFDYEMNISSEMPKNKARLAATADAMMEKQMQYQGAGIEVDLITPDEWLMMQDIPNKEYFQERMNLQRTQNWNNIVAQAVTQYAALVDKGIPSEQAINATAQTMQAQQLGQTPDLNAIASNTQMF